MNDKRNEVEIYGTKIVTSKIVEVQQLLKKYPSIRFIGNPIGWGDFQVINYGGAVLECNSFQKEITNLHYIYLEEPPKRSWWKFWKRVKDE